MTALSCPECGTSDGIYARLDARWQPQLGRFEVCPDVWDELDCTNCDHRWEWAETKIDPYTSAVPPE